MEPDDAALPLSRAQLDIWLSQESGFAGTEWQLGLLGRIDGTVRRDVLEQAIRQALAEAEPARAAFFERDGEVFQKPIDYSDLELPLHDVRDSDDPERTVRDMASSMQHTPMSLSGRLIHFALFRTQADEYYLFGLCHHISVDGLGMALVSRRIATIYTALITGESVSPAYFGSLRDFVDCEAAYEESTDFGDDQEYWSANLPPAGGLDKQLSREADEHNAYTPSASVQVDQAVVDHIKALSKNLRIRRYSVMTTACALLARAWSANGAEVALDFPVSRRVTQDSKTLPAMLAGVAPLVLKSPPEATVGEFLQHVDARIRELLQHQRFPVHILDGEGGVRGPRQASNRVAVNFIPSRLTLDLAGVPVTASYTNHGPMGHFGLFFLGAGDQLFLSTAGAGEPFAKFGVANLADRLQHVVTQMAADPDRRLSSLDLLHDDEHAELASIGNRAVLTRPDAEAISVPEAFAAHVAATPEASALTFDCRSWSYRELDESSNRLAHLLSANGVGPGEQVVLLSERSAHAVIAILAVLKAGGAYLPIDPSVPESRLEFVLNDACPVAVLTTAALRSRFDGHDFAVFDVEDPAADAQPATALPLPAPDDLAYVIYTSGTTGTPKGVAVTHHNLSLIHI